jgi:hypothetical protein
MSYRHKGFFVGQILIHLDVIARRQLDEARRKQIKHKSLRRIGEILIELGYVTEHNLNRALSLQKDIADNNRSI